MNKGRGVGQVVLSEQMLSPHPQWVVFFFLDEICTAQQDGLHEA